MVIFNLLKPENKFRHHSTAKLTHPKYYFLHDEWIQAEGLRRRRVIKKIPPEGNWEELFCLAFLVWALADAADIFLFATPAILQTETAPTITHPNSQIQSESERDLDLLWMDRKKRGTCVMLPQKSEFHHSRIILLTIYHWSIWFSYDSIYESFR